MTDSKARLKLRLLGLCGLLGAIGWPLLSSSALNSVALDPGKCNRRPMDYGFTICLTAFTLIIISTLYVATQSALLSEQRDRYRRYVRIVLVHGSLWTASILWFDFFYLTPDGRGEMAKFGISFAVLYVLLIQLPVFLWFAWGADRFVRLRREAKSPQIKYPG